VASIGANAFGRNGRLTAITVDEGNGYYSSDDYGALFNKEKTVLVQYPAGNTRSEYAIPVGVTGIGESAFYYCDSLTSITLPDGLTGIGAGAFESCDSLTSIAIPDTVTSIGDSAFYSCGNLTSVTLPNGLASIGADTFGSCLSLTSVAIPASVTSIGSWAFNTCGNLTSITVPASVTSIGNYAFASCNSLSDITIADGMEDLLLYFLMESRFRADLRLYVPASVTSVGGSSSLDLPTGVILSGKAIVYAVKGSFIAAWATANLPADRFQIISNNEASSNAALSNLSLSAGTLTPDSDSATTAYTANVANSVSSITVTATPADPNATATGDGIEAPKALDVEDTP
jgi:hypothetical protein